MPVTLDQRKEIVALLNEGKSRDEIAAQIGVSAGQVAAIKAHISMGTYDSESAAGEDVVDSALDAAFGLERDLQLALRRSIDELEPGLTVIDGGKEQTVASGRIDITARDRTGATVVIELKAGQADRDAIGQTLAYMGDLINAQGPSVRGIIVGREFTSRAVAASRATPNIRLVRYGVRFSFETIPASGTGL